MGLGWGLGWATSKVRPQAEHLMAPSALFVPHSMQNMIPPNIKKFLIMNTISFIVINKVLLFNKLQGKKMRCLSCDKTIADNAKFCNYCGSNQAELKEELTRKQAALKAELDKRAEERKIKNSLLLAKVRKFSLFAGVGALLSIGIFFAYDKSQGENLVDLKPKTLENSQSKSLVMDAIKASYKNYVPENECYVTSYLIDNSPQLFCIKLTDLYESKEGEGNYIYITLSGTNVDENFQPINAHVSSGSLEFIKLKNEAGKIKVISDSGGIPSGSWGNPGTAIITPLGKENIGWILIDGYTGMGTTSTTLSLFALSKSKIKRVFAITPLYNNKDACDSNNKSCSLQQIDLSVRQDKNQDFFYPIKLSGTITNGTIDQPKKLSKNYIIKYSPNSGMYELPEELSKLFYD